MADGRSRIETRPEFSFPEFYRTQADVESRNLGQSLRSNLSGRRGVEISLSSISAKSGLAPPITYWEKYPGPPNPGDRADSVWGGLTFYLRLCITQRGIRFFNLYCQPLLPSDQSWGRIEISWAVTDSQVILGRVGTKSGESFIEFQLQVEGRCTLQVEGRHTPYNTYSSSMRSPWTKITDSLIDTLRSTGAPTSLRVLLNSETDLPIVESFFVENPVPIEPPRNPESRYSNLQVAIEHRPARPQTNPHLDPRVYDPFPGMPVQLGRISHKLPELKSVPKSSSPAEPSQELAAMELSDGGGAQRSEADDKGASSDTASIRSSSSAWSFLGKSREKNTAASGTSSSTSSESLPSLPPPAPNRAPVVVKLESESDSDAQITETRQWKSKRLNGMGQEEVRAKEKRKKKHRDVVELIVMEEAEDGIEEAEDTDEEDAEAERKRKKKEKQKKRRNKNLDNDGDIQMESDAKSISTKKKKKKSRRPALVSDSEPPIPMKTKKKEKRKSKEKQPQSESDDPPPRKPSGSGSESRKSTKRKHLDSGNDNDNDDDNDNANEVNRKKLSVRRERLKKRIKEINMEKHELRVEEEELKAKLLRLDFTARQLDGAGTIRAHCVCSACKKYGHKKSSVICEMHPDAIRIALWRGK